MCGADGQGNLSAVQCGRAGDTGGHARLWRHQSVPEKSGNEFEIATSVHVIVRVRTQLLNPAKILWL